MPTSSWNRSRREARSRTWRDGRSGSAVRRASGDRPGRARLERTVVSAGNDALVEASRWLDATLAGAPIPKLLLVLGLGEGHLLDLLETRAPGTRVLAIEPDPGATRAFRARRDWKGWLQSGRLIYL